MHIKKLSKLRPKYGLKSWPLYSVEQQLFLTDCVEITSNLKAKAGISNNQALWDDEKINKLLKTIRNKKAWYAVIKSLMVVSALMSAVIFLLALACIFLGNDCAVSYGGYINLAFGTAAFITAGSFLIIQNISRDNRDVIFSDFLSSDLSLEQKKLVIKAILKIKREAAQLFEVANYESLRKIPKISWKAENWFLLLTENAVDRRAIWLKGVYPKGKIYVAKPIAISALQPCLGVQKNITPSVESSKNPNNTVDDTPEFILVALDKLGDPWGELRKPYSKYLYSDKARLQAFVESMKPAKKSKFQTAWHNAMMMLLDSYDGYTKYLADSQTERGFEEKFVQIFALISDDYRKKRTENIKLKDKNYELGISGTQKFLQGKHDNIENWIRENIT